MVSVITVRYRCQFAWSDDGDGWIFVRRSRRNASEIIEMDGAKYKTYFGSASQFQKGEYKNVEGKKLLVPYRGYIDDTLNEMEQDLQSAISYAGGRELMDLRYVDYVIVKNSIVNGDSY